MNESTAGRAWSSGTDISAYARMIPGRSKERRAWDQSRTGALSRTAARKSRQAHENGEKRRAGKAAIAELLPHPVGDRFALFRSVFPDLAVVGLAWAVSCRFLPMASLPWQRGLVFGVMVTLFGFSEGLYRDPVDPYPSGTGLALTRSTLFASILFLASEWNARRSEAVIAMFIFSLPSLVGWRRLRRAIQKRQHKNEVRKVLVVGGGPVGRSIARALRGDPAQRAEVCGFVDDVLPLSPAVLGRVADLDWLARAQFIDEVILALPGELDASREAAAAAFRNHLDIRAVPLLPPGSWPDSGVERIGDIPVITLHREAVPGASLFFKRLLDLAGATTGMLLMAPAMAMIALLIKMDSPGPVFYSAERTGAKGRRFRCHKFRSMVTDAEKLKEGLRDRNQRQGPIFKIDDDPRITHVGKIIRRYSLDELPQLWNVFCGEMSLVGPRPHPVQEVDHYDLRHYRRLDVKPGMTGLWQVTARDCPYFELNMHLDLTYIENWTLRLDFFILAKTLRVLFAPDGI